MIASAESASAAAFDPYPRALCRAQLPRYLNCCSELLALSSKLAAQRQQLAEAVWKRVETTAPERLIRCSAAAR